MLEFAADKRTKGRVERLIHKNRLFLSFLFFFSFYREKAELSRIERRGRNARAPSSKIFLDSRWKRPFRESRCEEKKTREMEPMHRPVKTLSPPSGICSTGCLARRLSSEMFVPRNELKRESLRILPPLFSVSVVEPNPVRVPLRFMGTGG